MERKTQQGVVGNTDKPEGTVLPQPVDLADGFISLWAGMEVGAKVISTITGNSISVSNLLWEVAKKVIDSR